MDSSEGDASSTKLAVLAALGLLMSYGSYKFSKKMITQQRQEAKKEGTLSFKKSEKLEELKDGEKILAKKSTT